MSNHPENTLPVPTLLVVDDERNLRLLLSHALADEGYRVDTAGDGMACLQFCQQQLPALILMDALMPEMDGFACCQALHERYGAACPPVLMITALSDATSVEQAFAAGAADYVTKPIHWAVLRQRVQRLLQTSEIRQELRQSRQEIQVLQAALQEQAS